MPDNVSENPDSDPQTTDDVLAESSEPATDNSRPTPPIVAEVSASFVTQTGIGATVVCRSHDPLGKSCSCFTADEPDDANHAEPHHP